MREQGYYWVKVKVGRHIGWQIWKYIDDAHGFNIPLAYEILEINENRILSPDEAKQEKSEIWNAAVKETKEAISVKAIEYEYHVVTFYDAPLHGSPTVEDFVSNIEVYNPYE